MPRKKQPKDEAKQLSIFQEDNVMSVEEFHRLNGIGGKPKQKRVQHEKKYGNSVVEPLMKQLGLVFIHLKNICFNRFYHVCPHCQKKSLVICKGHINKNYAGYPDYMIVAGGVETKAEKYSPKKTGPQFRKWTPSTKSTQQLVCESLQEDIEIICTNEKTESRLIDFLKKMRKMIKGKDDLI